MKKVLLVSAILAFGAASASAADVGARPSAKAPAAALAPVYNWTGFYLGGQAGGASLSPRFDDDDGFFSESVSPERKYSFIGGVYGGYNWQFNSLVIGIDAQWSWFDDGSATRFPFGTGPEDESIFFLTAKVRDAGSVKARIGLAFQETLVYVAAGPAWANSTFHVSSRLFNVAQSAYLSGIAVATGVEHLFTPNWVVRGQIQYSDFRAQGVTATYNDGFGASNLRNSFHQQTSIVEATAGIAYKF